ncbi:GNAT family N-acetyltransferase [Brevibacillus sp. HB1.4B]|uniref:GNAT family N-acetyltransferase n=1 Tax=Brevibacillus sp. HB1.4B TaxID=2738845 RepID=UPI0020C4BD11|nr:GNAT family N-acetyltransferase [Brevibacillus sp. HB1.4B]
MSTIREGSKEGLLESGFSPEIVGAVVALTRNEGETYMEIVKRAELDPIARFVKLADLEDNCDLTRIPDPTKMTMNGCCVTGEPLKNYSLHKLGFDEVRIMKITLADSWLGNDVVFFFQNNIQENNDGISNREFLCPDGAFAAVRRRQVVVAIDDNQIVGALRFYPRKSDQTISLYQFAIRPSHRGQRLMDKMLQILGECPIEVICPTTSKMNEYYEKSSWRLKEEKTDSNIWEWMKC